MLIVNWVTRFVGMPVRVLCAACFVVCVVVVGCLGTELPAKEDWRSLGGWIWLNK